jgi:hypothetical protein
MAKRGEKAGEGDEQDEDGKFPHDDPSGDLPELAEAAFVTRNRGDRGRFNPDGWMPIMRRF